MQRFISMVAQHVTWKAALVCLALTIVISGASPGQAKEKAKKNKPAAFVFFKVLETEAGGGDEPFTDGNAYWYGQGQFVGSPEIYDLKVTLPANRKFPGFGTNGDFFGPGYINPTEMTYEISLNGALVRTIVFKGWASPLEGWFFLHDGKVDPVEGWPGAFNCPPAPIPAGFSFKHKFNKNHIQMFGTIESIWKGVQEDPCGQLQPSAGPLYVEGIIIFPKG